MSDKQPYSVQRGTAIHGAGHAVMAYLLHRPFTEISVIEGEDSLGHVKSGPLAAWFRPDLEMNARSRSLIEDRTMICLAGSETESAWCARLADAPADWREHVDAGARQYMHVATWLWGDRFIDAGGPELEAYLEWLRQRVLGFVGHGADFDPGQYVQPVHDFYAERMRFGDPRFWPMVYALADAVQEAGTVKWRRARLVLRDADPLLQQIEQRAAQWRRSERSK